MIKVGSKVYIVPEDTRSNPYYATVTAIGKKYIHVAGHISESRFGINNHKSVDYNDWNAHLTLYECKEDYDFEQQALCESKELIGKITKKLANASLETLRNIYLML